MTNTETTAILKFVDAARDAWERGRVIDSDGIVHRLDEPGLAVCGPIDSAVTTDQFSDCPDCNPLGRQAATLPK